MNLLLQGLSNTVATALEEDIGSGDVTAALIAPDVTAVAHVFLREEALICGRPWFDEAFLQLDPGTHIDWAIKEGSIQPADTLLCSMTGAARNLLSAERVALNFLQLLSGTATTTQHYVKALRDTSAQILDTRKTLPGLRLAQKYAVRCGGGKNHRMGLFDQILIKENHIAAAGSIAAAVSKVRELRQTMIVEVETENLDEFKEALTTPADIIMLDNYSLEDMRTAVRLNDQKKKLEASGNVTLSTVRGIAQTGVDYISSGTLTKDVQSIDLSMRIVEQQ